MTIDDVTVRFCKEMSNLKWFSLISLFSTVLVFGQVNDDMNIVKNRQMNVFLQFEREIGNNIEINLQPIVDDFSRVLVNKSYELSQNGRLSSSVLDFTCDSANDLGQIFPNDVYQVSTETVTAVYKKSYSLKVCRQTPDSTEFDPVYEFQMFYFPLATAVITVDDGEVSRIEFDDSCFSCSSSSDQCLENFSGLINSSEVDINTDSPGGIGYDCGFTEAECEADPSLCSLSLFIVWRGTDKNGEVMESSALRVSRFAEYNLHDVQDFLNI